MAQSSFPAVADQIISFNKNIIEILGKIDALTTTEDQSINMSIYDNNGNLKTFAIPSFNSLKSEIDRLNNNINSLYNIDSSGSLIQTSNLNKYKKIITVDLNKEPNAINSIGIVNSFKATNNWFFDSLMSPMISVELDLTNQVENNVRKILSRRYILNFEKTESGDLTTNGQSALNSFNLNFRNNAGIKIEDFENWHRTTYGLVDGDNPNFDEEIFDLQPHELQYDGVFSVLGIQEDRLNKKLWYVLDTLTYLVRDTNSTKQLSIDSEVIINKDQTSTRYKVLEISTSESNPRVRLERVEGNEAIPVGIGTLKIYSPILYNKKVRISIGYNERNIIFVKAINADMNLVSRNWSLGSGFWTNDLLLESDSVHNGLSMEQFYTNFVYDYGIAIKDMVSKKIPNSLAVTPESPTLNIDNFKVVQINKHLTDIPDSNIIKQKHNQQLTLESEIRQIQEALIDKNTKSKFVKFVSESDKKQLKLEIDELSKRKDSKSKLLSSLSTEIITLSNNPKFKVSPKFRLRGFWTIPSAVITNSTKPQEIVQFRVQYRYLSKDGSESSVEVFNVDDTNRKGAYSNWIEYKTDARKRTYNKGTGEYMWEIEDIEKADTPNINQVDIAIQANEKVEFRVKSISEVGWPDSPIESDWSNILTVDFPDELSNVLNENDFILKSATSEELKVKVNNELTSKGLDEHLSDTIVVNNLTYHHSSDKILSGFKDNNGVSIDLYMYLKSLQDRITSLEEKIMRVKGELEVVIYRNNQEFIISNGSETIFNIDCEDYLDTFISSTQTGRVYSNDIYVIKDFAIKINNKSISSPLGILSNRTYLQNPNVYNTSVPQTFWVNEQDELITSEINAQGQSRTQLDNQFIWMVNYDSVTETSVSKLSENIGNSFITKGSNSLTDVLSSNNYNLGFNDTSILNFIGNNKSLLDPSKWIDVNSSISSTNKLLTTIHPVVQNLEVITETNNDKVKTIENSKSITIPLNIYFKMNALDNNQKGTNYNYINLNNSNKTIKHIKKVKFFLENESDNRPFVFSIKFNINRSKVIIKKTTQAINTNIK
ncbi:MAG: hypothetical protein M0R46_10580 [Candidatus Muirbacterium halophilum]|nr:hypothetical protein [Candidatus Muirbacterium halophilum]